MSLFHVFSLSEASFLVCVSLESEVFTDRENDILWQTLEQRLIALSHDLRPNNPFKELSPHAGKFERLHDIVQ